MVKPQQPELRRSDRGATSDDATKERLSAPSVPGVDGIPGRIPEANLPGHHPAEEQDKPSGRDFVAKMHALALEEQYEAPDPDDEVLDLTELEPSPTAERLAKVAGKPFELVGAALGAIRSRLPD